MDRLGLGFGQLSEVAPSLVYCSISGYGPAGPYKNRGGYDVIAAAIGGLLHITGAENGPPSKVGVAMTDIATGLYAHGAIMAALLQRETTGRGQKIDCSLLATQIASLINIGSNYLNCNVEAKRWGTAHESIVPYEGFATKDSYLVVGAGNDTQFKELCLRLGRLDLLENPAYATNAGRVKHRQALIISLTDTFKQKSTADWLTVFQGSTLPYGPINSMSEVFKDAQVQHSGMVQTLTHATGGTVKVVGPAVRYSASENKCRGPPPLLGEHTNTVLREVLDFSEQQLTDLERSNVIQCI